MKNYKLGGILSLVAALIGIFGHFILFFQWYQIGMHAESAEPGCEILLKIHPPILNRPGFIGCSPLWRECLWILFETEMGKSACHNRHYLGVTWQFLC